jgi:predicted acyltransferase
VWLALSGLALMGVAYLSVPYCPFIKNLWTSTFAVFSSGFTIFWLAVLMPLSQLPGFRSLFAPARVFGENPLLAYILCFLMAPLIDAGWFGSAAAPRSLRNTGQAFFEQFVGSNSASLLFALCSILFLYAILLFCRRRRWILKL